MKKFYVAILLLLEGGMPVTGQAQQKIENLVIITTDGYRWQEVFSGMDAAIANNPSYNEDDSNYIYKHYWNADPLARRKLLMPFFWNTISSQGQVYGNRLYHNYVNTANPYWFSYPGYSEIFTGYPDTAINSNNYKANPLTNVLEFLNHQPSFTGKVAAFGAWNAFDRILNEKRSGFPVFSAFDSIGGTHPTKTEELLNAMLQDSYKPFGYDECLDVFTHYAAMDYLREKKPKLLYIAYGETDEWAHAGKYRSYLDAAHQVDAWIKDIWTFLQNDPHYKNKTALFITVDHGRGDLNKNQWTDHGSDVPGANEIWFALLGPGISAKGEMQLPMQLYQEQFAQTIAQLLGYHFVATHPIGKAIQEIHGK